MIRPRRSVAGLMFLVLAVSMGFASLRFASEAWAGVIFLLTLGALSLAILATVYRRGAGRASWLGCALLGWGYMVLASGSWWDLDANRPELITTMLLDRMRPLLQPDGDPAAASSTLDRLLEPDPRIRLILSKLDQPISMPYPNGIALTGLLSYIRSATRGPNDKGIPIYVDPVGLQEAEVTMTSPVKINLQEVALRTALRQALRQLGLSYEVRDGLLTITAEESLTGTKGAVSPDGAEAFRRIGHCQWALLMGWLGGIAGRFFHATRDGAPEQSVT